MTTAAHAADVAEALLGRSRAVTGPALREAVDSLPGSLRHVAGYHFGWWDHTGNQETTNEGKALRPTLALLAAQAVGGSATQAVPAAVAVELVHNFSLIHDDVMDGDVTRRHRPTVWKVFGPGAAILVGDALLNLAFEVIVSSRHPARDGAQHMLAVTVSELLEGQAEDLAFEHRDDVRLDECLQMAKRKTGALFEYSCGLGATFGHATEGQVLALRAFGANLGLAFQLVDDLLGIWGDPARTGKPVCSDLRSRKKSIPVVAALNSGSAEGGLLAAAYAGEGELSDHDLVMLAALIEAAGGRHWCQDQAKHLLGTALEAIESDEFIADTGDLAALATYLAGRDR